MEEKAQTPPCKKIALQLLLPLFPVEATLINNLVWLVQKELVKIYGYVIMPNRIHLMWEQLSMNGKEFPKNSFEKFTAKSLVNNMKATNDTTLKNYAVTATDRQYNIWLKDPLAIRVFSREMAVQKLDYMHINPMQPHWLLCTNPADYVFISYILRTKCG